MAQPRLFGRQPAQGVFHRHNRPIDDQPEIERPQAHQIAADIEPHHANAGQQEGDRNHRRHDQRGAPLAQCQNQYERHQQGALGKIAAHGGDSALDNVGTVIAHLDHHALGQGRLHLGQMFVHPPGHLSAVLAGEHHDGAHHGLLAVHGGCARAQHVANTHGGKISHGQRPHAAGELHRQRTDGFGLHHLGIGAHHQPAPAQRDGAATGIIGIGGNGAGQFGRRHPGGRQLCQVRLDHILAFQPADAVHFGDAGDLSQHWDNDIFLGFGQGHQMFVLGAGRLQASVMRLGVRRVIPFQRVIENLAQPGGDRCQLRRRTGRQCRHRSRQPFVHHLAGAHHIGAVFIQQGHLRQARTGERAEASETGLAAHQSLDRHRHPRLDLLAGEARHGGVHLHLHAGHIGNGIDGQGDEVIQANRRRNQRRDQHAATVAGAGRNQGGDHGCSPPPVRMRIFSRASHRPARVSSTAVCASSQPVCIWT